MKLLMWFVVGLNLFSANENWSINLVTAVSIYVIYKGT